MDNRLVGILACPLCKGNLKLSDQKDELWCVNDKLAFPIRGQVPVMLEEEARALTAEELAHG